MSLWSEVPAEEIVDIKNFDNLLSHVSKYTYLIIVYLFWIWLKAEIKRRGWDKGSWVNYLIVLLEDVRIARCIRFPNRY